MHCHSASGKAIQFPDDNHIEQLLAAVLNHVLKLRAVIRLGGEGSVYVMAKNRNAVLLREGSTLSKLTFDAFFSLAVGRIAGKVVGIFPNPEAYVRLVSIYLMEYSEDWSVSKAYLSEQSIAAIPNLAA